MTLRSSIALFFAVLLVLGASSTAHAAEPSLQGVHTEVADDSSAQIQLEFSGGLPDVRVVRSGEHTIHVVFIGAHIAAHEHYAIGHMGEIESGNFAGFAGIGMRMDLELRDGPLKVTTQAFPHTGVIVVHVPAKRSDNEALTTAPETGSGQERTAFIPLSFADVSEVAGILVRGATIAPLDNFYPQSPFAAPTPNPNGSSSSSYVNSRAPTYVTIPAAAILANRDTPQGSKLDDRVAIDRRLNAIILTGTPQEIADYRRIISYLDVPARSVLLETQIVELTQNAARDLGIDYSPDGTLATATFGVSTNNRPGASIGMRARLSALQESGQAKILAQPRILAINARPAAILSGEAVPIFNSVVVPSGGGTLIEQQIQYINVGVSLEILPRIASDGRVTTQVFSEVSSIIDYVQNTPRIAVRQGLASGIVRDGESLVIGGLLQETEITQLRKVPGLSDIPLIGGFFRSSTTSKQTTNLYLVITPHVLSNNAPATK